MFGYDLDTVKLHIGWNNLMNYNFEILRKILRNVTMVRKGYYMGWYEGEYKNFKITFCENKGITIIGSLSNYYVGCMRNLEFFQYQEAVEKLGKELHLDLHNAKIRRIDLALNIHTYRPTNYYTNHLFIDLSRFERLEKVEGVLFQTKINKKTNLPAKAFAIYNKTKHLKDKKGLDTRNCLRFEFRLFTNVSKVLGIKTIRMKDIYSPHIFLRLVEVFQKHYGGIKKQTISGSLSSECITPTFFKNYFLKMGIESLGGDKEAYKLIEQFNSQGKFKNPTDKTRCKDMIRNLSADTSVSILHPLAAELNSKVESEYIQLKNKLLKNTHKNL